MNVRHHRRVIIVGLVLLAVLVAVLFYMRLKLNTDAVTNAEVATDSDAYVVVHPAPATSLRGMKVKHNPSFPINDKLELPFLGEVHCHTNNQKVHFTGNGRLMEWPFKMFYLPNGMFFRAEFAKSGAKNYENDAKLLAEIYSTQSESYVGFPDKPAPASLSKVLQNLYNNEPFDRATKINITWILRKGNDGIILPWFIADVFGVSPGLMRVPNDDEVFLKYRVLFDPDGVAVYTDNQL